MARFAWEELGQGIQSAGQLMAQGFYKDWQMKREQDLWKEREEIEFKNRQQLQDESQAHSLHLMKARYAAQVEANDLQMAHKAEFDAWHGDPQYAQDVIQRMASNDPGMQLSVLGELSGIQRLERGDTFEQLEEPQRQAINGLPPIIRQSLNNYIRQNAERKANLDYKEQIINNLQMQINQMQANIDRAKTIMPGEKGSLPWFQKTKADFGAEHAKLRALPQYQNLMAIAEKAQKRNIPLEKIMPTGDFAMWQAFTGQDQALTQAMDTMDAYINSILGYTPPPTAPPIEEPEKKKSGLGKAVGDVVKGAGKLLGDVSMEGVMEKTGIGAQIQETTTDIYEGIQNWLSRRKEPGQIQEDEATKQQLAQQKNVPIHLIHDVVELETIAKLRDPKMRRDRYAKLKGAVFYVSGKLMTIVETEPGVYELDDMV